MTQIKEFVNSLTNKKKDKNISRKEYRKSYLKESCFYE